MPHESVDLEAILRSQEQQADNIASSSTVAAEQEPAPAPAETTFEEFDVTAAAAAAGSDPGGSFWEPAADDPVAPTESTAAHITHDDIRKMTSAYRREADGTIFISEGPGEGHVRFAARLGISDADLVRNRQDTKAKFGPWSIKGYSYGLADPNGKFFTISELDAVLGGTAGAPLPPRQEVPKATQHHAPEAEATELRQVLHWILRRAGGSVVQPNTLRVPPGSVWAHLESMRGDSDLFEAFFNHAAPEWLLKIGRTALLDLPRSPQPSARNRVILDRATGGQLLRTLVAVEGANALGLLEKAARKEGIVLALQDPAGMRTGAQLVESLQNGDRLLEWARQFGLREGEIEHGVMTALASYPPTSAWVANLEDEFAAVVAEQNRETMRGGPKGLRHQQAIGLLIACERPEIFAEIPNALAHQQTLFRGDAGKLIDLHFPSRVLFFLRDHWKDRSGDPKQDFEPYLRATPTVGVPQSAEARAMAAQFYRNYALLALGGIGKDYQQQRGGNLFRDLIERDLLPRNHEGALSLDQATHLKVGLLLGHVRRSLQFQPATVEAQYKFLIEAKTPETQLKMVGMYLATLPYRQHLLGAGSMSVWREDILSPRFARLAALAYERTPQPSVAPVAAFAEADKRKVRETSALRVLLEDERMSDLVPLVMWLRDQGKALEQYRIECAQRDSSHNQPLGTAGGQDRELIEKVRSLPAEVRPNSVGACVLGLVRPHGTHQRLATGEFGTPPDAASLMLTTATSSALTITGSEYIGDSAVVDAMDKVVGELSELGTRWKGDPQDWREFGALLSTPPFHVPLSGREFALFESRLLTVLEVADVAALPQMTYSRAARSGLDTILALPAAPALMRGTPEVEPAKVLQAAAYFEANPAASGPLVSYWKPLADDFVEQVRILGRVDVVPAPELHPDGSFSRPRRGVTVTKQDLGNGRLLEMATAVNALPEGLGLGLPDLPDQGTCWDSPKAWTRAAKTIDRQAQLVSALFGEHVRAEDLPRILHNGSTMARKHEVLLHHAADIAQHLFVKDAVSASMPLPELLNKTKDLLAEINNNDVKTGINAAVGREPGRIVAAKPRELAPQLMAPAAITSDTPDVQR